MEDIIGKLDQLIEKLGTMSSYFQKNLDQEKAAVTALAMVDQKDIDALNSAAGILTLVMKKQIKPEAERGVK